MGAAILIMILAIPVLLTLWNIVSFIICCVKKREGSKTILIELISIFAGFIYQYIYMDISNITFAGWTEQIFTNQKHSMIAPDCFPTILVISCVAFAGYLLLRFVPADKQSPIISVLGISAVYLGIAVCFLWCLQTGNDYILIVFPANCILLFIKTIYLTVYRKSMLIQEEKVFLKYPKLSAFLNNALMLPWIAVLLLIPLLGIIIMVLFLFGQAPDSIIKAWTDTADWTLSQKIAPQSLDYDEHYLCTVAAGGHRNVVKPLRTGKRHGHQVLVNRQLCIANAFEQVLEEKMPRIHKMIRDFYDTCGYPIAKHIHSKYAADFIYFIMKPLEWLFLLVLYSVDIKPENRIAVQYPHAKLPEV